MIKKKIFEYKVNRNGCHVCISHNVDRYGYPRCKRNGTNWLLYRYIYFLNYGDIPKDKVVRHICDNRLCINPKHLILGTHQDNMEDCKERERHCKGEKHLCSKLNNEKVLKIRKLYKDKKLSYIRLGKLFNVTKTTIYNIVNRNNWKHVGEELDGRKIEV